jgi:FKBP-type peptidyl-prolyl cis-trans isomerase FkpA
MHLTRLLAPIAALALASSLVACNGGSDVSLPLPATSATTVEATTFAPSLGIDLTAAGWTKTPSGLYYRTLATPTGTAATAANGQRVSVRYTGWLANGTQFESSSIGFVLGRNEVIAGWDQGIVGMRVGERRQLLIPPALGYGPQSNGPIPANSVLVFNVELLSAT